jgi:hypothetical protein
LQTFEELFKEGTFTNQISSDSIPFLTIKVTFRELPFSHGQAPNPVLYLQLLCPVCVNTLFKIKHPTPSFLGRCLWMWVGATLLYFCCGGGGF